MPRYDHVIWDWNGTLPNDVHLTIEIMGGMLERRGLPPLDVERYHSHLLRLDTQEEQAQLAAALADEELARLALVRNQKLAKSGVASARDDSCRALRVARTFNPNGK